MPTIDIRVAWLALILALILIGWAAARDENPSLSLGGFFQKMIFTVVFWVIVLILLVVVWMTPD